MSMYEWNCILFHDVDVLPEDDRIVHTCSLRNPRHMAVALNKFGYKLPYATMFGTSTALTVEQFRMVNGFSNRFWGWGGEDDDLYKRVIAVGYDVDRYPESIAHYKMIKHGGEPKSNPVNKCRWKLLDLTNRDWKSDGLNNLNYTLIKRTKRKLYTHILVDLLESNERPFVDSSFCKEKEELTITNYKTTTSTRR
ncbi:N-acetyllactosaminide 3-alpha-galactosyltransferase [Necator americanus]|uniref:N-acetyllactosaminide 3-alpha-galactosyltransferase n=1 Tax=Necator americanus TaxID=51031 RepID=W2THP1_NECAM|nr:N-acetyllactosaminide 3-alpha-galactosyltransferase [Necator americanus]ETN81590.1 N-acetyllactosaminide 3-alpha-galactosyltransferase [Necator americanus]